MKQKMKEKNEGRRIENEAEELRKKEKKMN